MTSSPERRAGPRPGLVGTGWALAGELVRVGCTGVTFVLISRLLGPQAFGEYAGTLALVLVVLPFANGGAGHLLVMRVARRPGAFPTAWSAAVSTTLAGGVACSAALLLARPLLLPRSSLGVVLALALSELVCTQAVELSGQAFQAHDDMRSATQVRAVAAAARLAAVVPFAVLVDDHTVLGWSVLSLAATAAAAVVAVSIVLRRRRARPTLVRPSLADARAGAPFALGLASWQVKENVDQAMLLGAGFAADAGIYAAGYRIVGFAFLPIRAVISTTYPRFFRTGGESLAAAVRLARRLLVPTVAFSLLIAVASLAVLPAASALLGRGFAGTALVVQALALVPLLHVLQYLAGNSLTGAGSVRVRTALQVAAGALTIAGNLVLVPRYSWRGAVLVTYSVEVVLAVALWAAVAVLLARERARRLPAAAPLAA